MTVLAYPLVLITLIPYTAFGVGLVVQAARRRGRAIGTVMWYTDTDTGSFVGVEFQTSKSARRQRALDAEWRHRPGDVVEIRYCATNPDSACIRPALGLMGMLFVPLLVAGSAAACWVALLTA